MRLKNAGSDSAIQVSLVAMRVLSLFTVAVKAPTEPFLADVLAKPKIFLIGNAHDHEELAGHQP